MSRMNHTLLVSSKILNFIVNDLLDMQWLDQGKFRLKETFFSMIDVIQELKYLFETQMKGKRI